MIGSTGQGLGFLLGVPRSGTTLLSTMLERHPAIASPAEPWIMLALEQLGCVDVRHPANAQLVGSAVGRFWIEDSRRAAIRGAASALYGAALERTGKTFLVDKTPRYYLILDFLAEIFPEARFIWLKRDPLDVAASYRTTWQVNLASAIAEGLDEPAVFDLVAGLDRLERFAAARGEAVLTVGYEQLVAEPEAGLERILEHLGLAPPPEGTASLTRFGAGGGRGQGFGDSKILETDRPHQDSVGGWQGVFDDGELSILLDALGAERLRRLGYGGTVDALNARGVTFRGEEGAARELARIEGLIADRMADIRLVTSLDQPLHSAVQGRVRRALRGD
ncbi:sulfotransferase family protein [Arenibaculum pallidiluteum]|uniref:sulfotransferase family protein n=1 Tax=Arenibaculum pallidiluteum TaxID=2812559 RepID=UPI001A96DFCE|nr:sulfotransferase [Arenibaculum pallidiluteum]